MERARGGRARWLLRGDRTRELGRDRRERDGRERHRVRRRLSVAAHRWRDRPAGATDRARPRASVSASPARRPRACPPRAQDEHEAFRAFKRGQWERRGLAARLSGPAGALKTPNCLPRARAPPTWGEPFSAQQRRYLSSSRRRVRLTMRYRQNLRSPMLHPQRDENGASTHDKHHFARGLKGETQKGDDVRS